MIEGRCEAQIDAIPAPVTRDTIGGGEPYVAEEGVRLPPPARMGSFPPFDTSALRRRELLRIIRRYPDRSRFIRHTPST